MPFSPNAVTLVRHLLGESHPDVDAVERWIEQDHSAAEQLQAASAAAAVDPFLMTVRLSHKMSSASDSGVNRVVTNLLVHTGGPSVRTNPSFLGDYRIIKELGKGGMGSVYEVEHKKSGTRFAAKTILKKWAEDEGTQNRFLNEMLALAKITHPNVLKVKAAGKHDGALFFVTELLDGKTLAEKMKDGRPLCLGEAVEITRQAADGLAAMHALELVHRDIKPSNLWVQPDGGVRVIDLGLVQSGDGTVYPTNAIRGFKGSLPYASPEQSHPERYGHENVDAKSDVFSLGVVLLQMIRGGISPYFGGDLAEPGALEALRSGGTVPPQLMSLIENMLHKNPAKRPSIEQMTSQLGNLTPSPLPVVVVPPRRRATFAALAVALLFAVPGGYYFASPVVRFVSNEGVLEIRATDPDIEVTVRQNGVAIYDRTTKREFVVSAGPGQVVVDGPKDLPPVVYEYTISRGSKAIVTVTQRGAAPPPPEGDKEWWPKIDVADGKQWVTIHPTGYIGLGPGTLVVPGSGKIKPDRSHVLTIKAESAPPCFSASKGVVGVKWRLRTPEGAKVDGVVTHDDELIQPPSAVRGSEIDIIWTASDDDRRAAEAVLAAGGPVTIRSGLDTRTVSTANELPPGSFVLTEVKLNGRPRVTGQLVRLIAQCKGLKHLDLGHTSVDDDAVAAFKGITTLEFLDLYKTSVTDTGLSNFSECTMLKTLQIGETGIGDAGFKSLKNRDGLFWVSLAWTKVTDDSLKDFYGSELLQSLDAGGTSVSNRGVSYLKKCKKLSALLVAETKVDRDGVEEVKSALPKCKIVWNGGTINP
jgi:hypothetical protein